MVKQTLIAITFLVFLGSCSSLKPLNFTSSKPVASNTLQSTPPSKFVDDISVTASTGNTVAEKKQSGKHSGRNETGNVRDETAKADAESGDHLLAPEKASMQVKYASLLNTAAENVGAVALLQAADDWYGTPYRMGGTSKDGVDCSAFVGAVYAAAFAISLPRTARDQYRHCRHISRTQLKEGDLLFFNTRGYVSHVGIYLQNNKFIHASTSRGVVISDMFEPYYLKHFVGAGRIENKQYASD